MFTRLRNRVLLLNMALTTLILAGSFTAVYLVTSNAVHAENQRRLEASQSSVSFVVGDADEEAGAGTNAETGVEVVSAPPSPEGTSPTESYSVAVNDGQAVAAAAGEGGPWFSIMMDASRAILGVGSNIELGDEAARQAAEYAWQHQDGGRFEFAGRQWLYGFASVDHFILPSDNGLESLEGSIELVPEAPTQYQAYFVDVTDSLAGLQRLLMTFVLVGFVALGAIFFVSRFFANRSIRPVEQAWDQQRRFIADASHELKTPLTIITTNSDALLANEQKTIASQREWLDYLRIGTDRMQALIDGLLKRARLEEERFELILEPVDLSQAATDALDALRAAALGKGLAVTTDIEPRLVRSTDRELVADVFFALIDNAVKYADEGGSIKVSLCAERGNGQSVGQDGGQGNGQSAEKAVLTVSNSGAGIAEEDMPHIFERFYRASAARSGEDGSYGLGLSIVKVALDHLGGSIEAQSTPHTSTTFTVRL
jgi:signal transduction histidine kinase